MTFLPLARNSRSAAASSSSVGCVPPSNFCRSSAMAGIRGSLAATRIASVRSQRRVSRCVSPRVSSTARSTGSPESCSTSCPSGTSSSAALTGILGTLPRSTPSSTPKIRSSRIRCNALRSPSRPRHRPEKNERSVIVYSRAVAGAVVPAGASDLLFDPRRLAGEIAQVVELRPPHAAAAFHGDIADRGAVGLEDALDALAVGDLAHREGGVEAAVALGDDHALVGLHALAVPLHHLHLHHHGVARLEIRDRTGHALFLDFLNDLAHFPSPRSSLAAAEAAAAAARAPARALISSNRRCASSDSCAVRSRSGRRSAVRASACSRRQRRISA